MKVKDRLAELGDTFTYFGAIEGSGFVQIGKASNILKALDVLSERDKRSIARRLSNAEKELKWLNDCMEIFNNADTSQMSARELEERDKKREKLEKAIQSDKNSIERHKKYQAEWIPFGEREVFDEHKRRWEEPLGTILIMQGVTVLPGYWYFKEQDKEVLANE